MIKQCLLSTFRAYSDDISTSESAAFEELHPEKLVRPLPESEGEKEAPRPFGVDFKEPVPAAFGLSSTTEKITTISYPQLGRYRHSYQPRNIQDILRYTDPLIRRQKSYDRMPIPPYLNQYSSTNFNQYPMVQNQYQLQNQRYGYNQLASNHDPFYAFKPEDPSDINLMATASVRFAPPPWKNMHSKSKPIYPNHQPDMSEHLHMRDVLRNRNKPLVVTLNIFPMTDQDKMMMSNPQYQGQFSVIGRMMANSEMAARSNNMIIKFNLFPESFSTLNRQDRLE
ncbi:uncharacterized protein LOC123313880 isoform X2 [Coccinella septempunctata]|uniref:uncharacterized protein LOC123313880 isoform X2 n=1 Tax=Coccinella septempunctata TaxID=41139 RepID=UPI001D06ADA4|nr:uncharacterized protein LOC123313880 isoform X2 [Coccinella septempunctata]